MLLEPANILVILKEINSSEEKSRRALEFYNKEIYEGELYHAVQKSVKKMFPETGEEYTIADYNVHEKIADKKSKAYIKPPQRKLEKETESAAYNKILSDFNFNDTMKLMDLYKNRHRYCGVGVIRNRKILPSGEKLDIYDFWSLAPYEFNVHRDGTGMIYAWSLPMGKDGDYDIWVLWSASTHIKIRTKDYESYEAVANEGNLLNVNPYGVIPFCYVPMDASGAYKKTSSIPRQTVTLNTNISIYLTAANMQIGQMVVKHPEGQVIKSVSTGLMTALTLPQKAGTDKKATEVAYLSPQSDLSGQREAIVTYMTMILDQNGINGSSALKEGETFTSGFDRLLANADVQDIVEDNQDAYTRVENEIYKIIKAMNKNDYLFSSEKLKVVFAKPKILTSDSEKLGNLEKKKGLKLWEEWELVQEADPNLSEEEAKEKLKRIKAEGVQDGNQEGSGL